jgi:hypothetical protein
MSNDLLKGNSFAEMQAIINAAMAKQNEYILDAIKDLSFKQDQQSTNLEKIDTKIDKFNENLPLFAVECDRITSTVKSKGVNMLGGKKSSAYRDPSIRGKVYSDIHHQLKREFSVTSFKAIKRNQIDIAISVIEAYQLPIALEEEIRECNSQVLREAAS